jgi:hypothetical protein
LRRRRKSHTSTKNLKVALFATLSSVLANALCSHLCSHLSSLLSPLQIGSSDDGGDGDVNDEDSDDSDNGTEDSTDDKKDKSGMQGSKELMNLSKDSQGLLPPPHGKSKSKKPSKGKKTLNSSTTNLPNIPGSFTNPIVGSKLPIAANAAPAPTAASSRLELDIRGYKHGNKQTKSTLGSGKYMQNSKPKPSYTSFNARNPGGVTAKKNVPAQLSGLNIGKSSISGISRIKRDK